MGRKWTDGSLSSAFDQTRTVTSNLLPELGDGGDQGQVGGVGRQHEGSVHAAGVLDAAVGVPGVVALGPGQLRLKTLAWDKQEVHSESTVI